MSGVREEPVTARAVLSCQICGTNWFSVIYTPRIWGDSERMCAPAWDRGWRVFVGQRGQHTYCPAHGPTVPMRQVLPREVAR